MPDELTLRCGCGGEQFVAARSWSLDAPTAVAAQTLCCTTCGSVWNWSERWECRRPKFAFERRKGQRQLVTAQDVRAAGVAIA